MVRRDRRSLLSAVSLTMAVLAVAVPGAARAACDGLLPSRPPSGRHPVRAVDLAMLRDIGASEVLTSEPSPLAVSPDGRKVAFVLSRADPASDSYCRDLMVLDLAGGGPPRIVDRGGTLITSVDPFRGHLVPDGAQKTIQPAWSADGRYVAYLRRDTDTTQIWVVDCARGTSRPLTHSRIDVDAFDWTPDGTGIVYASRPGLAEAAAAIDAAARTGWLYDDALSPDYGARPQLPAGVASVDRVALLAGGERSALPNEQALLTGGGLLAAALGDGRIARLNPIDARPFAATRLVVEARGVPLASCRAEACASGVFALFWDRQRGEILFLRRQGFNKETTALYAWSPANDAAPRLLLATTDALFGCVPAPGALLCLDENATTPRRIVRIDRRRGTMRPFFNPNPEAAGWDFGRVERLRFTNDIGLPAWGDLVLPPDYRRGTKVPMVVVQYHSTGFLRGGTGDEYPIHALAARGIAILSFERPPFFAQSLPDLASWDDFTAANGKNWAERRNILSSLEAGVRRAIATGTIDPTRIGITGLSDGSSTARFALINAPGLFRAAAISTCCVEMRTTMTYGGTAWADSLRAQGYPSATAEDLDFWRPYSMALNASRMTTPILMQLADNEYLLSLETVTALREHRQPVEMYVFPDEFHIKWHPAHRLAIYQRNIDWFAYWLLGETDPDPAKTAQYRRWAAMPRPSSPGSASGP